MSIWLNMLVLGAIALVAAIVLFIISRSFKVIENPKIAEVEQLLPQANCGGCGKAGCHAFASACAETDEAGFAQLYCPVGGADVMSKVAAVLGFKSENKEPEIAVLRCNGSCTNAPAKIAYDAITSCRIANNITVGSSGCPDGCLHLGDCVRVCRFGALSMDETTGLPVVDESKCTSCGACVQTCPRGLFELRPRGQNGKRVYVACRNRQKGALARKNCQVACIGCMKCTKICSEIKVENNLSYIPTSVSASQYGAELAANCPTKAIVYLKGEKSDG